MEYETVEAQEVKYGTNNFIEISKKDAIDEETQEKNIFYSIVKGYYQADKTKRFMKTITLPSDIAIRKQIAKLIEAID